MAHIILPIVNDAAENIGVHISFQISVFVFFEKILRNGIAGLHGSSIFFFFFLEVPWLGLESELLQLLACATATAMRDPSHICDQHHSSRQHQILLPTERGQELNPNPRGS